MKMSQLMLGVLLSLFGSKVWADKVSQAKAAELALHRVERLVILKKIEESFLFQPLRLNLVRLDPQTESDPVFRATLEQFPAIDGTQKNLVLLMNGEGKTLSHVVNSGGEAQGAPQWPDIDPVTLLENALHYILDFSSVQPELTAFDARLSSLVISQSVSDSTGVIAVIDVRAQSHETILRIRIRPNGDFESAEYLPLPVQ